MYRMSHISFAATNPNEGGPITPWYSSTYLNSEKLPTISPALALGGLWELEGQNKTGGGNAFMLVKASEALALGDVVCWSSPGTDTASTSSTSSVINLTTGNLTVNAEVDNFVFCATTTGGAFWIRRIKANTANTLTISHIDYTVATKPLDGDALATNQIPTSTDPISIIRPYRVSKATSTLPAIGVALGTVTSGYYTIIQVAGLALCKYVNTANAVVGAPGIVSGTAGVLTGGGGTANAYHGARFVALQAASTGSGVLLPWQINNMGQV